MAISLFDEHRRTRRDLCLAVARLPGIEDVDDIRCAVDALERYIDATGRKLSDDEVHALLGESGAVVEDDGAGDPNLVDVWAPEIQSQEAAAPAASSQEAVYAELHRVAAAGEACPRNDDLDTALSLESGQAKVMVRALQTAGRIEVERRGPLRRLRVEGAWTGWTGKATAPKAAQAEEPTPDHLPVDKVGADAPSDLAVKPQPRVMVDPVPEARRFLMTRDHVVVILADGKFNVDQRKILTGPELVAMANRHRRELNLPELAYR